VALIGLWGAFEDPKWRCSNDVVPNASNPLTLIGVEKTPTPCVKKPKTAKKNLKRVLKFFGV
jgi:hypothetical protein